jgi:hypothetical protein
VKRNRKGELQPRQHERSGVHTGPLVTEVGLRNRDTLLNRLP